MTAADTPAGDQPAPALVRRFYVVTGAAESTSGGILWGLVPIDAEHAKSGALPTSYRAGYFGPKVRKHFPSVGGIYSVEANADGSSIAATTARYERSLADGELALELSAKSRATVDEIESRKARAKREKRDPLVEALAPIRRAYLATTPNRRAFLLAEIVDHITRAERGSK